VTLSDEEAKRRGTQKTILERKAPPTFDVLVEIQGKDRFAIHHDLAEVVDQFLRGVIPSPEVRVRREDGEFEIVSPAAAASVITPTHKRTPTEWLKKRVLHIYPYGVTRKRLERAIRELRVPAYVTTNLDQADLVLTLKGHHKDRSEKLRKAADKGVSLHTLKADTLKQIQDFLRDIFEETDYMDEQEAALHEVEEAITKVVSEQQPVELQPHNAYIRGLQHRLVEQYGLLSESKGHEPLRRVVIYPAERG